MAHLPVYTIGRTFLIELFHTELQSDQVRFPHGPLMRQAYDQLANLETGISGQWSGLYLSAG